MAVIQVTEVRKPQLSYISKNGRRVYHVFFDEYTDYNTMFNQAAVAVDEELARRYARRKSVLCRVP